MLLEGKILNMVQSLLGVCTFFVKPACLPQIHEMFGLSLLIFVFEAFD
jgi:hypothetical protein